MDDFDIKILRQLQLNNKQSTESIGDSVGLSATACQRRIKTLRQSGVIKHNISVIDPLILGGFVTVIVEVTLNQGGGAAIEQFKEKALQNPEVQQCYYVAGEIDFILIVSCQNMRAYEQLSQALLFDNSHLLKFKSIVAMDNVKVGLSLPL